MKDFRFPALGVGLLALPACQRQSAMAPAGEEAVRVALLSWILFVGAALVLLIVLVALVLAIAGPERVRRLLRTEGSIRIWGIVFPSVTLAVLLGYGVWLMRETIASPSASMVRIEITGEQFWWRIAYEGEGGSKVAEANEIRVPVGVDIEFVLRTADVIHSYWVPSLGGKLDMVPGRTNRLRLRAERPGIYRGQCAEYCGTAHAQMSLEIVAVSQAEFDAWLAAADAPPAPAGDLARRGAALFIASGCGACHAVRGTSAAGTIAPDLSRIGERRSLAAATLPNTAENRIRFIANPGMVKPGSRMPPFAIFSADEQQALTAYLGSLK
ncbi:MULTISPECIES: cytochrome c oxidase subunit II [unclassified Chelatococcus]|uniref:cytochrome c oxidase subunit II n=1 Tax=unclassified Chelatococcus TaxID=2638111 RepID=UPI001BD13A39|nr:MULTISPECIES: cytochrome c oxidase subunit II [unclassified Chelatococcus]MBS7699936.1 cytochrome c oxidase subunit II [Chelatococcus sp. YT9]MBX3558639.1 cytochrome c oxidase subunit II [Chelatococcus sp.]